MKSNKIRKTLTALIVIFGLLIIFGAAGFIGAGGILNEMDLALEEIENSEKKNQLENISIYNKFYLLQYDNSSGLRQHIREYENHLHYRSIYFFILVALFFFSIILRIYFRKRKGAQISHVKVEKEDFI